MSKPSARPSVGLSPTQKLQKPHEGSLVTRASCCQPSTGQWEHGDCGGDVPGEGNLPLQHRSSKAPAPSSGLSRGTHTATAMESSVPPPPRPFSRWFRVILVEFLIPLGPCSRRSALSDCRTPKWPLHPSQGTQSIPQGWSPNSAPQAQPGSLQLPAR